MILFIGKMILKILLVDFYIVNKKYGCYDFRQDV